MQLYSCVFLNRLLYVYFWGSLGTGGRLLGRMVVRGAPDGPFVLFFVPLLAAGASVCPLVCGRLSEILLYLEYLALVIRF